MGFELRFRQVQTQFPLTDRNKFVSLCKDTKGCSLGYSEKVWLEQNHQAVVQLYVR